MFKPVCSVEELRDSTPFHFSENGRDYILIKLGNEIFALDGICTHEYAELWNGFVTEDVLTCPLHLSQFNIRTGEVVTPPAEKPLRKYSVKVEHGRVYVDI
jgi:3-phenylpropionate/trans-cinnamate dioxygenase ferredoxin subunit